MTVRFSWKPSALKGPTKPAIPDVSDFVEKEQEPWLQDIQNDESPAATLFCEESESSLKFPDKPEKISQPSTDDLSPVKEKTEEKKVSEESFQIEELEATWTDAGQNVWDWGEEDDSRSLLAAADEEELDQLRISAIWPSVNNVFASELEQLSYSYSNTRALERLHMLAESGSAQVSTLTNTKHPCLRAPIYLCRGKDPRFILRLSVSLTRRCARCPAQACVDTLEAMLHSLAALRHRSLGDHARDLAVVGCAAAETLLLQVPSAAVLTRAPPSRESAQTRARAHTHTHTHTHTPRSRTDSDSRGERCLSLAPRSRCRPARAVRPARTRPFGLENLGKSRCRGGRSTRTGRCGCCVA